MDSTFKKALFGFDRKTVVDYLAGLQKSHQTEIEGLQKTVADLQDRINELEEGVKAAKNAENSALLKLSAAREDAEAAKVRVLELQNLAAKKDAALAEKEKELAALNDKISEGAALSSRKDAEIAGLRAANDQLSAQLESIVAELGTASQTLEQGGDRESTLRSLGEKVTEKAGTAYTAASAAVQNTAENLKTKLRGVKFDKDQLSDTVRQTGDTVRQKSAELVQKAAEKISELLGHLRK